VAKRSPILGYNHNVRYRGLVFHVQTEDSGVMSPHLFTHLFHEGVIVSTRKLVYDASASEDAIKSLMQAQHKAVLKDLKIHTFDDKIDAYLGNTPGLEPRASVGKGPRVSDPEISIEPGEPVEARAHTEPSGPPTEQFELREPETVPAPKQSVPTTVIDELSKPRTKTAERTSRGSQFRSIPPPAPPEDSTPEDIQAGLTVPTPSRATPRAATPPPIPQRAGASKTAITLDSSPEIEIISDESESGRTRGPRDTAVDNSFEDAIPSAIGPDATIPSDGIPPRPIASPAEAAPPHGGAVLIEQRPNSASRPPGAAQGAALLPAMRQPSRPAITPPSVVSRPLPPDPNRVGRGDSEAIEIYAPAPPSVEPPPGERSERPGQYSMKRREISSQENVPLRDQTGRVAVPAGLARPRPANQSGSSTVVRPGSASSPPVPTPGSGRITPPSQSDGVVRNARQPQSDGVPQSMERPLPPARTPHITAPIASRTGTGVGAGNVITTRPAVIVGAPPKPPGTPNPQRVRKAREDEGRGFGQGLISEKSLDEVILAYLSEDADEK
jgi:hypothetical protein